MNRFIIVGSPRTQGRSAALAENLFEACIEEYPEDELALAPLSTLHIEGCTEENTPFTQEEADLRADTLFDCDDDMAEIYEFLDAADELVVVSPVFFSAAPAQLCALMNRLQPYYFTDVRKKEKRPLTLHIVGEGGDPHGYEALITQVKSAFAVAGFKLDRVLDWVGKISETGEILEDADVIDVK
ncbi:MAG: flavodoxin family protein [Eggerthellaceae bacterium]|jgi:multimeric flavodoxin WrbA